ncbi:hypothetical protein HYPSUDRAFT_671171 [Hypholoma sublateritium FD-334 SS-4]|uniref:Uncharacterized protein n=1 Tax=Hypholoma sublateritium (strain FD-334 SS-4) TaxID=945553 RepID=A0A0D2NZV7_HYPSF|nr:hypothetical protein HYPSUDRAFT_671171 [Hypholoma sublateritium FD-334 SS-4]
MRVMANELLPALFGIYISNQDIFPSLADVHASCSSNPSNPSVRMPARVPSRSGSRRSVGADDIDAHGPCAQCIGKSASYYHCRCARRLVCVHVPRDATPRSPATARAAPLTVSPSAVTKCVFPTCSRARTANLRRTAVPLILHPSPTPPTCSCSAHHPGISRPPPRRTGLAVNRRHSELEVGHVISRRMGDKNRCR